MGKIRSNWWYKEEYREGARERDWEWEWEVVIKRMEAPILVLITHMINDTTLVIIHSFIFKLCTLL